MLRLCMHNDRRHCFKMCILVDDGEEPQFSQSSDDVDCQACKSGRVTNKVLKDNFCWGSQ